MILDETYRLHPGISNSAMKDFVKESPKVYFDKYLDPSRPERVEFSTEATDIGDLFDCEVTSPHVFDKYYYISSGVKGTAEFKAIVERGRQLLINDFNSDRVTGDTEVLNLESLDIAAPFLVMAARQADYRSNYGDAALMKYMLEHGGNYYKDLSIAKGRKVIDQELYNIAIKMKGQFLNDDRIGPIFMKPTDDKHEPKFQFMVTTEINGMICKILLDVCMFDTRTKTIYPKDVKTSISHKQFRENYIKLMYGQQGAFYTGVLRAAFPEYKVMPFEFIVGCTESGEDPMIYRMNDKELSVQTHGAILKSGRVINGWMNTLQQIKWHTDNAMWRYPKEFYENGFVSIESYTTESIEAMNDGNDSEDFF